MGSWCDGYAAYKSLIKEGCAVVLAHCWAHMRRAFISDEVNSPEREVAALFYSLVESVKLNGLEPKACLRMAVMAALRGERIPLPHEVAVGPP